MIKLLTLGKSEPLQLGGYPSELTTSAPGYFYFIKVDQGLLVADRVVINGITIKDLNSHNQFKGSGIRCLTFEEAYKLIHSDLNGSVSTGYLTSSFALTGNNLFQDCFVRMDSNVWIDYAKVGIRPANNIISFDRSVSCTPAYEYIDNSKSTNIFY